MEFITLVSTAIIAYFFYQRGIEIGIQKEKSRIIYEENKRRNPFFVINHRFIYSNSKFNVDRFPTLEEAFDHAKKRTSHSNEIGFSFYEKVDVYDDKENKVQTIYTTDRVKDSDIRHYFPIEKYDGKIESKDYTPFDLKILDGTNSIKFELTNGDFVFVREARYSFYLNGIQGSEYLRFTPKEKYPNGWSYKMVPIQIIKRIKRD